MTTFTISNDSTDFGTFEGETPAHALAAMHRDAGYASKVVDGVVVPPASAVDADGVSLCPGIDDVTIAEVPAEDHGAGCERVATRAHRFDARVIVDQENSAEAWWDAARADAGEQSPAVAALFARIDAATSSVHGVCCRAQDAEALIAWASDLPGWGEGPEHARNPLLVQSA